MPRLGPRNRELIYLVGAFLLTGAGFASVFIAREQSVSTTSLTYLAFFAALYLVVHAALRLLAPRADPLVLPLVAALSGLGLTAIYRIDPAQALRQAAWFAVSAVLLIVTLVVVRDHRRLERITYVMGVLGVILLVVTAVVGTEINGAKLWISLPGGQTIQLGEFTKLCLIVFVAGYLRTHREMLANPKTKLLGLPIPSPKYYGPLLVITGATLLAVVFLNDFGSGLLFFGVFLAMLYLATNRASYVVIGLLVFAGAGFAIYQGVPRIHDRVQYTWLDPYNDRASCPKASATYDPSEYLPGTCAGFQSVQAINAISSGGLTGTGLGKGIGFSQDAASRNGDLSIPFPELKTDFIFVPIATELGLVGAVAVLLLFLMFVYRGLVIAQRATDGFSKLLAGGLAAAFAVQTFLIVGGVTRLIPLTGITLPFLSYGGSSVLSNFLLVALLLRISDHSNRDPASGPGETGRFAALPLAGAAGTGPR